jgi:hypothetical protein
METRKPTAPKAKAQARGVDPPDLGAEGAEQRAVVEDGDASDLRQRLHGVLHIHLAQHNAQPEAALELLDALVDVFGFQQVKPGHAIRRLSSGGAQTQRLSLACCGLAHADA